MKDRIESLQKEIDAFAAKTKEEVEAFRIQFLGQKGQIRALFDAFKEVPNDQKRLVGQQINVLKQKAQEKLDALKASLNKGAAQQEHDIDWTLPGVPHPLGSLHPLTLVRQEIEQIFGQMGFSVKDGPEVEDDWHNFSALNFPDNHPARDTQDTFFLKGDDQLVLRTQTSNVQIREMENNEPPIKIIAPGRVFRNEVNDATHASVFHQVEGLYIDEGVSFADLKGCLHHFAQAFFGPTAKIRLRPSYFPFTEPSAELDVYLGTETEKARQLTKGTGWLELLGCGMVDPAVLENCNIDPKKYTGFAFGMGLDRLAMIRYDIKDIRLLLENDLRFLEQFVGVY